MTTKQPALMSNKHGMLRFLATDLPASDLQAALRVIEAFKALENESEFGMPFSMWVRLEQLQDYLCMLTDPEHKTDDTRAAAFLRRVRKEGGAQ